MQKAQIPCKTQHKFFHFATVVNYRGSGKKVEGNERGGGIGMGLALGKIGRLVASPSPSSFTENFLPSNPPPQGTGSELNCESQLSPVPTLLFNTFFITCKRYII
jgi:hypothetical protein